MPVLLQMNAGRGGLKFVSTERLNNGCAIISKIAKFNVPNC